MIRHKLNLVKASLFDVFSGFLVKKIAVLHVPNTNRTD